MKRNGMRKTASVAALLLAVTACAPSASTDTTTQSGLEFPVTVEADNGSVTIEKRPEAIISLSSTATEMLFDVGAGPQVIAVDDQSNYPAGAPMTDLSGVTPNLEAILSLEPDLVVIFFDPGDLIAGLETVGIPVLSYGAALAIDDVYRQIDDLGMATGNVAGAAASNSAIAAGLEVAVTASGDDGEGVTYYHEISSDFYTATSSTFFGEIYALFGMVNIADSADADGSAFGYPQISSEYIVTSNPDIIFLANVLYGESAETVAERPGWDVMTAVQSGHIAELDSDVASRGGPRIVEFAESIADSLGDYATG
ncbi:MAG: ABC transporter substrate-binding protein [Actinobacteria bacterium]|nr:ABC transporter substrate-binding protein [Actinomycetota bacterium]